MITLPQLTSAPRLTADLETTPAGDLQQQIDALPQGFVALLGNRLLSLAQQSADPAISLDSALQKDAPHDGKKGQPQDPLSALMAALDSPAALDALLRPENTKETQKSADDKDSQPAAPLTLADQQNLQALFAMLPPAVVQPPTTLQAGAGQGLAENKADKSLGGQSILSSLTSGAHALTPATDGSDTQASTLPAASQPAAAASVSNSPAQETAFQPLLNSLARTEAKPAQAEDKVDISALSSVPLNSVSHSAISTASASATSATPSTPMLNAQLGSHEWQQALSQQILLFTRNGQHNAELRLNPEELGAIQISLKLDNDQAQLSMVSGHSHVRAALEAAMPQLRTALAESGINLGQSNVSSDAFAQGQSFSGQQQAQRDNRQSGFTLNPENENDIIPLPVPASLQARAVSNGKVDTFA